MTHSDASCHWFISMTWRIHMCDVTHSLVWQSATWFVHMCDLLPPIWQVIYVSQDVFIRVTWRIHTCVATRPYVSRDSFTCVTRIHMCGVIRWYVWLTASGTGWRRPIGCLKLQVIFCKRATNYRALLRKMTCEDKASYESSPPCIIRDMTHSYVWNDIHLLYFIYTSTRMQQPIEFARTCTHTAICKRACVHIFTTYIHLRTCRNASRLRGRAICRKVCVHIFTTYIHLHTCSNG